MKLLVFMGDDYVSPSRSLVTVSGTKDKAVPGESIMRRLSDFLLSTRDRFKLYYSGIIAMLRQQIEKAVVIFQTVIKTDLAQKLNPRIAALFLGSLAFTYAGYEYYPAYSSFINQEKKITLVDLPSKNISNLKSNDFSVQTLKQIVLNSSGDVIRHSNGLRATSQIVVDQFGMVTPRL